MVETLGERDLFQWLESLGLAVSSIGDVGKGAILCQILNLVDNAELKYRISPETENDYLFNLLLAKNHMDVRQLSMILPIEKMCKLDMNDNLEVLKWFYKYWKNKGEINAVNGVAHMNVADDLPVQKVTEKTEDGSTSRLKNGSGLNLQERRGKSCLEHGGVPGYSLATEVKPFRSNRSGNQEVNVVHKEMRELDQRFSDLLEVLRVFENERDFYFDKLVSIEKMLIENAPEAYPILKEKILNILYEVEFKEK